MRRFEFKDGSSNKFWEVLGSDNTLTVRFRRIGAKGQEKSAKFPSPELAYKEHERLIAEKLRKGYKEVVAADEGNAPVITPPAPSGMIGALRKCEPLKRVARQLESLQRVSLRITTVAPKKNLGRDQQIWRTSGPAAGRQLAHRQSRWPGNRFALYRSIRRGMALAYLWRARNNRSSASDRDALLLL